MKFNTYTSVTAGIRPALGVLATALTLSCLVTRCYGQGTLTFRFEGQPVGTRQAVVYSESGVRFSAHGVGQLFLSGGGVPGDADNGTGYLLILDGYLTVNYPIVLPPFNVVSFDAAEYAGTPVITAVGYKYQYPMGPIVAVMNSFTLDGINDGTGPLQDFQTFYLDSSFSDLLEFDILHSRCALDNLVISGVPEPSSGALIVLGIFSAMGWAKVRRTLSR